MNDISEYERMEALVEDDYTCQSCGAVGGADGGAELHVYRKNQSKDTLCRSCFADRVVEEDKSNEPGSVSNDSSMENDSESDDDSSNDSELGSRDSGETVMFFPSRREIVVDSPSENSKSVLSQASHLVDSTDTGFMYKVDEEDVWNSPYESFESLVDELKSVVGGSWDGGFESRIRDDWERAHQFVMNTRHEDGSSFTVLRAEDAEVFENVAKRKLEYNDHYVEFLSDTELRVKKDAEGSVKEKLYEEGYPVTDLRDLDEGDSLDIELNDGISLRGYQRDWVDTFLERKSGVFVGPPGSGKTVAAIGVMSEVDSETLIIVPSRELAQQWADELVEKTSVSEYQIGQYHGGEKNLRPITIATYDIASMSRHRKIFRDRDWGLVVLDESHHACSSHWRRVREIQSTARLGLTATPVREQGDSKEIYSLIGPPLGTDWGGLFADGWVEKPEVELVMVPWESDTHRNRYKKARGTSKMIEASKNPMKAKVAEELLSRAGGQKSIIFVDWIEAGESLAEELGIPFVYGETSHSRRQEVFEEFRSGRLDSFVISRVGDEGIDLPNAEVAIFASTLGSSRAQTGQRAGRTMRPVGNSEVYVLLTKGSGEEDWGRESTQYLAEKGVDISRTEWGSK